MNVVVIGSGYVGLVSGTCFSEFGAKVVCIDTDENKINQLVKGIIPIYEPGLSDMVLKNHHKGNLDFSLPSKEVISNADIIFIAVGTPERRGDGHADLSYVYDAVENLASDLDGYTVIVNKSTVPVGTARKVRNIVFEKNPKAQFDVASNPEFLREGSAIEDFMNPDRVIIGTDSKKAEKLLRNLYQPLFLRETPILFTDFESAEIIKYASNAFLATKISFINEISSLCEKAGGDIEKISTGMGFDSRIGDKFLNAGPGYGGSCFPKDTLAILKTAEDFDVPLGIIRAAVEANENQKIQTAKKITEYYENLSKSKPTLTILGLSFKPNTDDMRDSPSLKIIEELHSRGFNIKAHDPICLENAKDKVHKDIKLCNNLSEAAEGSDGIVLVTEWNDYRALNFFELGKIMNKKILFDLRNIYNPQQIRKFGFEHIGIGKKL